MSITENSVNKIVSFYLYNRLQFDYDYTRKEEESYFDYLKKICLLIKDKKGLLTVRERLAIIAEIYSDKKLTKEEKEYLYLTYLKEEEDPEKNNTMFWRLTEREKTVEWGKELWVQI